MNRAKAVGCIAGLTFTAVFVGLFFAAISNTDIANLTAPHVLPKVAPSALPKPSLATAAAIPATVVAQSPVNVQKTSAISESADSGSLHRFIGNVLAKSPTSKTETTFDDSSSRSVETVVDDNPRASPASVDHPGWLQATGGQCWLWDPEPQAGEAVTWTGKCDSVGRATGHGLLVWMSNGQPGERYDVDMFKGRMSGLGVATAPDGSRYEGEYKNNLRNGIGILTLKDGSRYEGGFKNEEKNGHGVFKNSANETYDGEWLNGRMNGHGTYRWPDGTTYEGDFKVGEITGHGIKKAPNGTRYEGEFKDAVMNGPGTKDTPNGTHYEVMFKAGHMNGHGIMISPDGTRFEGEFQNDQPVPKQAKAAKPN